MKRILVIVLVALATLVAAASSRALDAQERENRVTREKPETEPHAQQADEQAANDQRRTNQDSPLTRFERYQIYFSGALVFLTAMLVGVTCVYAYFSYQQWNQMRNASRVAQDSLDHARTVAIDTSRPWLGISAITLVSPTTGFAVGHRIGVHVAFQNFGHGPALALHSHGGCALTEHLPTAVSPTPESVGPNVLFPGQTSAMFFYTDEPPSAEQAQAITAHTLYFIVAGRLAYKDSASQDRVTEFCAVYEPLPINRFRPIDGLNSAT